MIKFFFFASAVLAATLVIPVYGHAQAKNPTFDREAIKIRDSIVLKKSQSTLYGEVKSEGVDDDGRKFVVFETTDGTVMKLDVTRVVYRGKVRKIDATDNEYNSWIEKLQDEPNEHWEAVEWLKGQPSGTVRFKNQIKFHLERIMELDPNDENAKRALNYTKIDSGNRWVPEIQYYDLIGYEKRGTRGRPKLQKKLSPQNEINESIEGERKQALRRWQKEAKKRNANATALRNDLTSFVDAPAVQYVFQAARDENNPRIRMMFIEAIGRVQTRTAQNALCVFAMEESVVANRERALTLLSQEFYPRGASVGFLSKYLFGSKGPNPNRSQLLSAAFAIGELGDVGSTLTLSSLLVTKHQTQAAVGGDGRMQQSFGNDGNLQQFNMGESAPAVVRPFDNKQVLDALKKLTDQDFGYNSAGWRNWFINNHTSLDTPVRR